MELILDERVRQELLDVKQSLETDGKLLTADQLKEYYLTFRNRFGPEKLGGMDGINLLETMHGLGTKEGLIYWLEFKHDSEFPSTRFGSISGGSVFKFGLFRKQETGIWTTGSPSNPVELTIEEAIAMARRNRDQLVAGARLLAQLPAHGSDQDYGRLQEDMERVAPNVSDYAWGHKYFHLLYPEKLDDFHNPNYQRFHLMKLLQQPPQNGGRYIAGGRFVALVDALQIPMNILTTLLSARDGSSPYSYWRVGTSDDAKKPKNQWAAMRDGNWVGVGWGGFGSMDEITNNKAGKDALRSRVQSAYPSMVPAIVGKTVNQLFNIRWMVSKGDVVLASDGASVLGIGKVTGDYFYDATRNFPHCRPVEWLSLTEWKQPDFEGKLTSWWRMQKDINLVEVERSILGAKPIIIEHPRLPIPSPGDDPSPPTVPLPPLDGIPGRVQAVLERKGQVILYGPPGTGKTYWAEQAARELAARASFHTTFDQLTPEQRATLLGEGSNTPGRVRICTFHPAYGYEDFLEGLRPVEVNGHLQFVQRNGIFKQLCQDAYSSPDDSFYLIIDEINRGDIPRIFGELLTVLEKDKRGKSILLPLTNNPFHVPNNVFVIGTMNTADRSIALLDTALRRRFGFIELMPDYELLKNAVLESVPLGLWLEALNHRICELVGRDARNLQIGHAYFLQKGRPIADFATFARVIREDIIPLLEEYCYEDYTKLGGILGSVLVDASNQKINYSLFSASQQDNLVDALLQPYLGLTTSVAVILAEAQEAKAQQEENGSDYDSDAEDGVNHDLVGDIHKGQ